MGLLDLILDSALGGSKGQGGTRDPKVALLIGLVTMLVSRRGGATQGGGDGGGLLGLLGGILGSAGGGAVSDGLDGVLGGLFGGVAGGVGQATPSVEAGSLGGLDRLFQILQNTGLGDALNSWIGAELNQSVSTADISRVFGDGQLQRLADSVGVSQGKAAKHLGSLLPEPINKLTPDGQAPQGDPDIGPLLARFN